MHHPRSKAVCLSQDNINVVIESSFLPFHKRQDKNTDQTSNETADDRLLQLDLATGKEKKE
jgi:hypothetical protein